MSRTRRHFTPEQKAEIVRRHLAGKEAVSDLADRKRSPWGAATRAEAHLLRGENDTAAESYQTAAEALPPHDCRSMGEQGELIVGRHSDQVQSYWTKDVLRMVFGNG